MTLPGTPAQGPTPAAPAQATAVAAGADTNSALLAPTGSGGAPPPPARSLEARHADLMTIAASVLE